MTDEIDHCDVIHLEEALWLVTRSVGVPAYDYDFERCFICRRPWQRPTVVEAVARMGVVEDYADVYARFLRQGVRLIHSPDQYALSSRLSGWYPLIEDLTPRSHCFAQPPPVETVESLFQWPVFLKGDRQTSRHRAAFSIIRSAAAYREAIAAYAEDPVLRWQTLALRAFVPLRPVPAPATDKIPPAFEFRTFWWRGQCVGFGAYWSAYVRYQCTPLEELQAIRVARTAVERLKLPFLVVDLAQTASGAWIVIECNDGQESGYADIQPLRLWQKIVAIERERMLAGT